MKRLSILLLTVIIAIDGNAQFGVQMGAGYSPKYKSPTAELFMGATFMKKLTLAAGFQTHLTNIKQTGCLFQGRIGFQVNPSETVSIIPYIGATQLYRSADNKALNEVRPLFALEVAKQLWVNGVKLYGATCVSGRTVIISAGIRLSFLKE